MLATNMRPKKQSGGIIEVESIKIGGSITQQVRVRKTQQFTATITPANATDQTVIWVSSNTNAFTVGETTGLVTGVTAGGSGKLTATAHNGKSYSITVSITA